MLVTHSAFSSKDLRKKFLSPSLFLSLLKSESLSTQHHRPPCFPPALSPLKARIGLERPLELRVVPSDIDSVRFLLLCTRAPFHNNDNFILPQTPDPRPPSDRFVSPQTGYLFIITRYCQLALPFFVLLVGSTQIPKLLPVVVAAVCCCRCCPALPPSTPPKFGVASHRQRNLSLSPVLHRC